MEKGQDRNLIWKQKNIGPSGFLVTMKNVKSTVNPWKNEIDQQYRKDKKWPPENNFLVQVSRCIILCFNINKIINWLD